MQDRKKEKVGTAVCKGHVQARSCGIEFIYGSTRSILFQARQVECSMHSPFPYQRGCIYTTVSMTVMTPPEPSPDAFPDVGSEEDEPVPGSWRGVSQWLRAAG